jgi:hypothetical protein
MNIAPAQDSFASVFFAKSGLVLRSVFATALREMLANVRRAIDVVVRVVRTANQPTGLGRIDFCHFGNESHLTIKIKRKREKSKEKLKKCYKNLPKGYRKELG